MRVGTALLSIFIAQLPTMSVTSQERRPVAVGELAPDFTLEDQNKNKVTLSAAIGSDYRKRPTNEEIRVELDKLK